MKLLKSDRRVIMLLMVIAVVCICVMIFRDAVMSEKSGEIGETSEMQSGNSGVEVTDAFMGNADSLRGELGTFDPNTVDSLTLLKYGLGPVQIRSLMGYRRHKGTFDKPLAVSKLYNWADEDVDKVLPYIVIGDEYKKTYHYREQYEKERRTEYESRNRGYGGNGASKGSNGYEGRKDVDGTQKVEEGKEDKYERKYDELNKFKTLTKVDINTADTTLLKRIPGVGSGIANAIVKLRGKLGGFYKVEQLEELKFVPHDLYVWFKVEANHDLHLININKASFQTLNAHPYISYDQTRDLMTYRRLYGEIKDAKALVNTHIFTQEQVERLMPYLEFE